MKTSFVALSLMPILAMPLMAVEGLELELIAPQEPVVLEQSQLDEIAMADEADEALQKELVEKKLNPADRARLGKIAMSARNAEQGIVLTYRIKNTSEQAITLDHGGDGTTNFLKLEGPGAKDLPFVGMMTMEFRMGKPLTIEAGGSKEFTIKELAYGKRDLSRWVITKPGKYEVILTQKTKAGNQLVELVSNTATFTVKVK